jgi:hypothetical protein
MNGVFKKVNNPPNLKAAIDLTDYESGKFAFFK